MYFCTKVMYFVFYYLSPFFPLQLFYFPFYFPFLIKEKPNIFHLWSVQLLRMLTICRRGNKHFDVHLRQIRSVHFLLKYGKGASHYGRDGWKSCIFPACVGIFDFDVIMYKVLFPICTLTWRVNNYVSRQGRV